jgi:hypothetical protein
MKLWQPGLMISLLILLTIYTSFACSPASKSGITKKRGYPYWQSSQDIFAKDMAQDDSGNIYICGSFIGKVDFDPGPGEVMKESTTNKGGYTNTSFLLKFGPSLDYKWVITDDDNFFENLELNGDSIFVAGEEPNPQAQWAGFLARFDSAGNEQWTQTWGEPGPNLPDDTWTIAIDSNLSEIYVCGSFQGKCSYQTSTTPEEFQAVGPRDGMYAVFDLDGNFLRAKVQPGRSDLSITESPVKLDGDRNTILIIDDYFGASFDKIGQNGLVKLDKKSHEAWSKIWDGGNGKTGLNDFTTDDSGNIYLIGYTLGGTDLDPGPADFVPQEIGPKSYSKGNPVMIKLSPSGDFQWADVWGGSAPMDTAQSVCFVNGEIWVAGICNSESNLAPERDKPGQALTKDLAKNLGSRKMVGYISRFDTDGHFLHGYVEPGVEEYGHLAVGENGTVYVIGHYGGFTKGGMILMSFAGNQGATDQSK